MKLRLVAILALLTPLFLASAANAENPQHVKKLLSTGTCFRCDLSGANLSGTHLIGVDLREANLQGANLTRANLEGADIRGANLEGANLTAAFLTNADLKNADLDGVNLTEATVYFANVYGASMEGMILTDANILNTAIGVGGETGEIPDWY